MLCCPVLPRPKELGGKKAVAISPAPDMREVLHRISRVAARAHYLGTVEAPDREAAEAFPVKTFGLTEDQRKRLASWE